ncbi:unnamed protein product, partial [Rotaria sordida]
MKRNNLSQSIINYNDNIHHKPSPTL